MTCFKPNYIENPQTGDYMAVDCGKCNFCLANRRDDWAFRLSEEEKVSTSTYFVTLTYDQKHVPRKRKDKESEWVLTLKKEHAYRFLKTIKQAQKRITKELTIRYFLVGEYGTDPRFTKRPHYHLIMFNLHPLIAERLQLGNFWERGIVDCQLVHSGAHAYVAKYMIDRGEWDKDDIREKPFNSMSKGNRNGLKGLGQSYWNKNRDWHRAPDELYPDDWRYYLINNGYIKRLPRFYKKQFWALSNPERADILEEAKKIFFNDAKKRVRERYEKELERLKEFHKFPAEYYQEQLKYKHDQVRIKSLQKNKI